MLLFSPLLLLPPTDSGIFYSVYFTCCLDGDKTEAMGPRLCNAGRSASQKWGQKGTGAPWLSYHFLGSQGLGPVPAAQELVDHKAKLWHDSDLWRISLLPVKPQLGVQAHKPAEGLLWIGSVCFSWTKCACVFSELLMALKSCVAKW